MADVIVNNARYDSQYHLAHSEIIIENNSSNTSFSWNNISVEVPLFKSSIFKQNKNSSSGNSSQSSKQLLSSANGVVHKGTLLAIMGASGAGKSTLLKVLAGCPEKNFKIKGTVMFKNKMVDYKARKYMGFVQQDDIFIGTLTVRQHLMIQAGLLIPNSTSLERNERVEQILFHLNLLEVHDSLIGISGRVQGLSGGELRRLAIASELLKDPKILFADEPTSGLDSFMAKNIVISLRKLADQGKIVICTIHQPSSEIFEMFDQLYLLAGGRNTFSGSTKSALNFFQEMGYPCPINYNPADHYIATLAVVPGDETAGNQRIQKFVKKNEFDLKITNHDSEITEFFENRSSKIIACFGSSSNVSVFTQFGFLLKRSFISTWNDVAITRLKIMQAITMSLITGLIYLRKSDGSYNSVENYNGALFLSLTNISFGSTLSVIFVFPAEFIVYRSERRKGLYRTCAYFISRTLIDIPLNCITVLIFSAIFYFTTGFYNDAIVFFNFYLVMLLVSETSKSWGYFISSITSTVHAANTIATPLMMPFLTLGGLFVRDSSVPVYFKWLHYISWFKYGYESLIVNQYQHITSGLTFNNITNITGSQIIETMEYDTNNLYLNIAIIMALMFGFRLIALFCLIIRANFIDE